MRKFLLMAAFAMIVAGANAQETSFGIKVGPNFANLGGDVEENKMKIGFHLGGVANIMLSESFAFAPELLISTQGTKWSEGDYEENLNFSYLNLPLLAKFYVSQGLSLHAGPSVGFLLSAKSKGEESGDEFDEDVKDDMKGFDFGLAFGAGYELANSINFGARYNLGVANIAEEEEGEDFKWSNQVIQLYVGYTF